MGALTPLALTIAPDMAKWLSGDSAAATEAAISDAVLAVTGTTDAADAAAALGRDPSLGARLRVQFAQITAHHETLSRAAEMAQLADTLRGVLAPSLAATSVAAGGLNTLTAWSAPIISATILVIFGLVMTLVLIFGMRPGSETTSNMLLGTLAAMATSVVSYWVGSSAGSARKDDRLAQISK